MRTKNLLVTGLLALSLTGAAATPTMAREPECRGRACEAGREDVRHGRGADDGANHHRGRGADDGAGHQRRGRGADDGPNHT